MLAKSISLSKFSGLAARTVGVAAGRVLGHAAATRLIGGVAGAQLVGADRVPIEAAPPNSADTADPGPPGSVNCVGICALAGPVPSAGINPSVSLAADVPIAPAVLFVEVKPRLVVARAAV